MTSCPYPPRKHKSRRYVSHWNVFLLVLNAHITSSGLRRIYLDKVKARFNVLSESHCSTSSGWSMISQEGCQDLTGGTNLLLSPANEVWARVLFSQLFVSPQEGGGSAHRGEICLGCVCIQGGLPTGGPASGEFCIRGRGSALGVGGIKQTPQN